MSDAVLFEQEGGIVTLTLNRPEKRNPISESDVVDALVDALKRFRPTLPRAPSS
jgi:enoyl-CoA hydratase/carnithine racemase